MNFKKYQKLALKNEISRLNKLSGGKKLGQGSFGDVYTPNLRCNEKDILSQNKISKVFAKKDLHEMMKEIEEMRIPTKLDKDGKYFAKIYDTCDISESINSDHPDIKLVKGKTMYISDNLGKDLMKHKFTSLDEYHKCYYNIMLGLNLLHKNNIVHRDIKPENLTIKNGIGKIIDLGLAVQIKPLDTNSPKLLENIINLIAKGSPMFMPLEHFYLTKLTKNEIQLLIPFQDIHLVFKPFFNLNIGNGKKLELPIPFDKQKELIQENFKKLLQKHSGKKIIKKVLDNLQKWDVYSLGFSMYESLKSNPPLLKELKQTGNLALLHLIYNMIYPVSIMRPTMNDILTKSSYVKDKMKPKEKNEIDEAKKEALRHFEDMTQKYLDKYSGGRKKKVRKHQGINPKTGRLKRGWKYSGKKLKSGLPQIVRSKAYKKNKTKLSCRKHVQGKIGYNMKEFKKGKWKSRAQAIAVSFSQVQRERPGCKRVLKRKNN